MEERSRRRLKKEKRPLFHFLHASHKNPPSPVPGIEDHDSGPSCSIFFLDLSNQHFSTHAAHQRPLSLTYFFPRPHVYYTSSVSSSSTTTSTIFASLLLSFFPLCLNRVRCNGSRETFQPRTRGGQMAPARVGTPGWNGIGIVFYHFAIFII